MNSPFPGMDPYLEEHWGDIHARLIIYACDVLQSALPPDLLARVEERVFVEAGESESRNIYPDVRVVKHDSPGSQLPATDSSASERGTALAEPLVIDLDDEPVTETFLEIRDASSGNRLVTVVEILSLSNKTPGEGRRQYRQKRKELKKGGVSLVEIDLLRGGKRELSVPQACILPSYRTPYQVCVRRSWQPSKAEIYRVPLRERLPIIRVPLREKDADAPLDLQSLIEQCYRNGRYHTLDYSVDPVPPLSRKDAAWAEELLHQAGKR